MGELCCERVWAWSPATATATATATWLVCSRRVAAVASQGLRLHRTTILPGRGGLAPDLHVQVEPSVQPAPVQERATVRLVAGPVRPLALSTHRAVQGSRQGLLSPG